MIKNTMFYGEPTISDYREIKLDEVIHEYLLSKGTWDNNGNPCNHCVTPKQLVSSALFVYGLKSNATNKRAVEYYCEREARVRQIFDKHERIEIPLELWEECNEYNKKFCKKS